jgi:hypothetical protein
MKIIGIIILVLSVRNNFANIVNYHLYRPRPFSILTMSNVPFSGSIKMPKVTKSAGLMKNSLKKGIV